jgi:IclR family transcriptional regulator, KDG regulon repressor
LASAIQKTFRCIEALARSPQGMTVSEVASVAGFSRPAATRLLEGLMADSIIIRDSTSKRYRLGLRLYEWSTLAVQGTTPINIARKEFIKLSMELGRECNFLVLEDLDAVLLERSEDIDGVPLNRPIPGRRLWFQTASGKAIVANLAPSAQKAILDRTAKRKEGAALDSAALSEEFAEIKERGFAVNAGMRPEGLVSLGVPILGHSGYAIAAVGTFMPTADLEGEEGARVVGQMKATASRISHYLGYETEIASAVS